MDQNGNDKRPVLSSAKELKGRRAPKTNGSGKKRGGRKWIALIVCALLVGGAFGIYYGTDLLAPEDAEQESTDVAAENIRSALIERDKQDFDRVSIDIRDGDAYTVVSNVLYDEEGNVIDLNAAEDEAADGDSAADGSDDDAGAQDAADEAAPDGGADDSADPDDASGDEPAEGDEPADGGEATAAEPLIVQNYSIEGMPYFKVNESTVTSMANYAAAMTSQHTVEENAKDMAIYGLDSPSMTVNFHYKDGTGETIFFGDPVPTGSYRYVSKAGDPNVYMVLNGVYTTFNKALTSLHTVEMPMTFDLETLHTLRVEQAGKETVELEYLSGLEESSVSISVLKLRQPIEYDAHTTRGQEILDAAIALTINGYAGHGETEEELNAFGLAEPRAVIYMDDYDGNELIFRVGNVVGENSYVRIDDTGDVYTISNSLLSFLGNMRVGYLADQFTNIINILKVDTVTVEGGGETYALHIENEVTTDDAGEEKTIATYFFDGEVTEETPFKKLYQEIIGTILDNVSADYHHDGEVVAKVTYKLNTGAEDFVVEYLEYDKDYYAVRREGLTLFLIKHEKIAKMLDSCRAYRDGTFTY